jgi:anti-anti-sigma factor
MPHSLRRQVLVILLAGTALLTLLNLGISTRGLVAVRNQATSDSTAALQAQAEQYLLRVAQGHATSTSQTIKAVQQLAVTTRTYLQQPGVERPAPPPLAVARNGRQYSSGTTTVLVIPGADAQLAQAALMYSQRLEDVLPSLQITVPEIVRISYITAEAIRTYPNMAPNDPPPDWTPAQEAAYQASIPANNPSRALAWTAIHPSIDQSEQQVSAATPVYEAATFLGAVSVDVSLDRLSAYLKGLIVDQTGFAFLITTTGELVAVTEEGRGGLVEEILASQSAQAPGAPGGEPRPSMVAELGAGRSGVTTVIVHDRGYVLAYAPINGIAWGLGLASPLDEITARTTDTANRIATITNQSLGFGAVLALIAVILFWFGMAMVLRRQFVRPLTALMAGTNRIAAGELTPIRIESSNELGQLATAFNSMTAALEVSRQETLAKEAAREAAMQSLGEAVTHLEFSLAEKQQLFQMLRDVSSPVIPVLKGVLVMPLIGNLDGERLGQATSVLLPRVQRERARTVLIDITGVPSMDSEAATRLLAMMRGLQLLGARVILVGVGPEVAQMLTALDLDLSSIDTAADLRTAIEPLTRGRA